MPTVISDSEILKAFALVEASPALVLAVSGGPDSMALMHLARRWATLANRQADTITVATVDHGLRPESVEEATFVRTHARALGFEHVTLVWSGEKPATGLQAAARRARYALLTAQARVNGASLVTAHTRDDQAETLVMRLARGSGVDGLAAIAPVSMRDGVRLARPLLDFSKTRLTACLRARSVPFVRDPSNENTAFERVRLRIAMRALANAGVSKAALALSAARLGRSRAALDEAAERFLDGFFRVSPLAHGEIDREAFDALPDDIALRVLARVLPLIGGRADPPRMMRLERLLEGLRTGQSEATLGGSLLIAAAGRLSFYREPGRTKPAPVSLEPRAAVLWDRRFLVSVPNAAACDGQVRPLGEPGWTAWRRERKELRLSAEVNRLAALTTPALWREGRLVAAPVLSVEDRLPWVPPVKATLAAPLARFLTRLPNTTSSALGKDTPIPYL
ncbi:tRNA lysidine(34) synthetase TilS [Rhodomicrobium sp. Az07]|uniref:tRNA lysidine(34) synthetase TilS n=1 Tax=Rhodomicrobium sp. Az07 TaxID=2839034 RepID=UPI002037124C|nr:tRNA lysidine(34) synthetase TilS [Rhodomicrobium sp. Az07]